MKFQWSTHSVHWLDEFRLLSEVLRCRKPLAKHWLDGWNHSFQNTLGTILHRWLTGWHFGCFWLLLAATLVFTLVGTLAALLVSTWLALALAHTGWYTLALAVTAGTHWYWPTLALAGTLAHTNHRRLSFQLALGRLHKTTSPRCLVWAGLIAFKSFKVLQIICPLSQSPLLGANVTYGSFDSDGAWEKQTSEFF